MKVLTKCEWRNLKLLKIEKNPICDNSLNYVKDSNWKELTWMNLCNNDSIK